MKNVYVDVTQLCSWQGKVTGIQRVMYEISSRFKDDADFAPIFVAWHKGTATFHEVDFDDIEKNLIQTQVVTKSSRLAERKAQYVALFKRVYHHVPLSRTMYNVYSSARGKITKIRLSEKTIMIQPGSILFMPHGGVWESHTYIAEILRLKKKHGVRLAPILFDMCPVISPQFVVEPVREAFEDYMKQILPESDLILAISKNTVTDAKKWLKTIGLNDDLRIEVFRLGDEVGGEAPEPAEVPHEFALCVCTIEARKNHMGLYYAYKLAAQNGQDLPQLVIVGRRGWMSEDIYNLMKMDPEVKDKFVFLHNATDSQLAWLYTHALFTVYPSFYEGWGLPIAESLLRGTPCIASETSSMKEVGGELVDYFSPFSPEQIKEKIYKYYADRAYLKDIKEKIKNKYQTTTWDMSYAEVAKEIKKL